MFIRKMITSRSLINKSMHRFFHNRTLRPTLTGSSLEKFRKVWSTLSPTDKMSIAINQRYPQCGDVLISQGDFHRQEANYELAIQCYKNAIALNKDCEMLANKSIAEIEEIKRMQPAEVLKKTDLADMYFADNIRFAYK